MAEEDGFKQRMKWALDQVCGRPGMSNKRVGVMLGVDKSTINNYRHERSIPNVFFINTFCREFSFNYDWLVFGFGEPYEGAREEHPEMCGSESTGYKTVNDEPMMVCAPKQEYVSEDDFGRAVTMLKNIFDAPDPLYRQAIVANLRSFHRAVGREVENNDLKKQLTLVESRLDTLEKRIEQDKSPPKKALREEV